MIDRKMPCQSPTACIEELVAATGCRCGFLEDPDGSIEVCAFMIPCFAGLLAQNYHIVSCSLYTTAEIVLSRYAHRLHQSICQELLPPVRDGTIDKSY
jgi:hypothetical protein